jgi:transmembrane E3 ubiquitin-protein ligase
MEPAAPPQAAAEPDVRRQRGSIPSFLFITFLLFMLTHHSSDEFVARNQYQAALDNLTYQTSNFTAWLNGTDSNFTLVCPVFTGYGAYLR